MDWLACKILEYKRLDKQTEWSICELILSCSGWNYPDTADKGGWTGVFYPTEIPKDFAIILNCSTQERWTLLSTTDLIHK